MAGYGKRASIRHRKNALDADKAMSMLKMLDVLEDLDDVQKVYSNADISENVMAQLG